MNTKKVIKSVTYNAIVCALYIVMVFIFGFMSYNAIQIRLAEILILLVLINKKYTFGITLGCFVANLIGPFGLLDAVVGGCATLLSCIFVVMAKKPIFSIIIVPVCNILVGLELAYIYSFNFEALVINTIWVMIGEAIAMTIGYFVFKSVTKNNIIVKTIGEI
jgi:uncharacterized membrane protein